MSWSVEEVEGLQSLLFQENIDFVQQGLFLWETLTEDYHQHCSLLRNIAKENTALRCSSWQFFDLNLILGALSGVEHKNYIALWFLARLAGFDAMRMKAEKLKSLSISMRNNEQFPDNIGNLKHLEELHLNIRIRGKYFDLENIDRLKSLRRLSIEGQAVKLPDAIGYLSNLEQLEIRASVLVTLPKLTGLLEKLNRLTIRSASLNINFPIGILNNLEHLTLELCAKNAFQCPNLKSISALTKLKDLNISGAVLTNLSGLFSKLQTLEQLTINRGAIEEIPEEIGKLTALNTLILAGNHLRELPESIARLKKLALLDLSDNYLSALPESFGQLDALKQCSLQNNNFEHIEDLIKQLPEGMQAAIHY